MRTEHRPPGAAPERAPAEAGGDDASRPLRSPAPATGQALAQAGEMAWLTAVVFKEAITRPVGYWGALRDQLFSILKLCWLPMVVATTVFGLGAPGLQALNLFSQLGVPDRIGSFFVMASIREFAPWINAMVVAGVVGTAVTADLGARKIREEIDAMEVMGVDPIRTLVVPRVLALFIITGLLDLVALTFGVLGGYIAAVVIGDATTGAFTASFFDNATTTDVWATVAKTAMFGLIIGVVCCYKGMTAQGGPAGVGRAVNQAVVITFCAIWISNFLFTNLLLAFNPDMLVFK